MKEVFPGIPVPSIKRQCRVLSRVLKKEESEANVNERKAQYIFQKDTKTGLFSMLVKELTYKNKMIGIEITRADKQKGLDLPVLILSINSIPVTVNSDFKDAVACIKKKRTSYINVLQRKRRYKKVSSESLEVMNKNPLSLYYVHSRYNSLEKQHKMAIASSVKLQQQHSLFIH